MVIFEPRILFRAWGLSPKSSWPLNRMDPVARPLPASRPMAVMKVWLLPDPLSPTTPRHSPAFTDRDTPRTASTRPSSSWKLTFRSSIDRMGSAMVRTVTGASPRAIGIRLKP
jgi:hypothetical protein